VQLVALVLKGKRYHWHVNHFRNLRVSTRFHWRGLHGGGRRGRDAVTLDRSVSVIGGTLARLRSESDGRLHVLQAFNGLTVQRRCNRRRQDAVQELRWAILRVCACQNDGRDFRNSRQMTS
jgi:hypothetical protein